MEENSNLYFTSSHIEAILHVTRKVLLYWRKIGLLAPDPSKKSRGGHYRYSFTDLVTIKTIINLKNKGASTYRIKKAVEQLKKNTPEIKSPLSELSFRVVNRIPCVVEASSRIYDPVTGQYDFVITPEKTKSEVRSLTLNSFEIPERSMRVRAAKQASQ